MQMTKRLVKNFILKERRLNFSTEASFRPLFEAAPYPCWRWFTITVLTIF
jgi:hypothetical protein